MDWNKVEFNNKLISTNNNETLVAEKFFQNDLGNIIAYVAGKYYKLCTLGYVEIHYSEVPYSIKNQDSLIGI